MEHKFKCSDDGIILSCINVNSELRGTEFFLPEHTKFKKFLPSHDYQKVEKFMLPVSEAYPSHCLIKGYKETHTFDVIKFILF